jgi:hypothetical protein
VVGVQRAGRGCSRTDGAAAAGQTATPFDWRYSRKDANDYLARLAAHENQAT